MSNHGDSALILLEYASRVTEGAQTTRSLSEATGIPTTTLGRLIRDAEAGCRERGGPAALDIAAHKYGYQYRIHHGWQERPGEGRIIDAVRRGYERQ